MADTSLSGARVARERTALLGERGKPLLIVSDNGIQFAEEPTRHKLGSSE